MLSTVEVKDVCKRFGSTQVINHCGFKLYEGEIYGLLGTNGAGKTTMMKMILGLQKMDAGSICVLGKEVSDDPGYLSEIGNLIENSVFYEHLNAVEILTMHLMMMQRKADIAEVLHLTGLDGAAEKPVSQYSLGMRQRLGFARAIIHRPKILILDEPLNGLDPIAIMEMRELMRNLASGGMTILLSSHIIGELRHTADRIGILSNGSIKQEFSVRKKISEYGEKFEDYVLNFMRRNEYESVQA